MQAQLQDNELQITFPMTARDEELEFWATLSEEELEFSAHCTIRSLGTLGTNGGFPLMVRDPSDV